MKEMSTNQVVNMLLVKEAEIVNKFHQAISETLQLEYDTERGKKQIPDLISSVQYSLDEIERIVNR